MAVNHRHYIVHALCLLPLLSIIWDWTNEQLGANPVESLIHQSGEWGLRLLILTLAATSIKNWFNHFILVRHRRALGLWSFTYLSIHLLIFVALEHRFDFNGLLTTLLDHKYVFVGFAGFATLIPLAITSTHAWQRRLGRTWKRLHRLSYLALGLGLIHFWWLTKADFKEPIIYTFISLLLLLTRILPINLNKKTNKNYV